MKRQKKSLTGSSPGQALFLPIFCANGVDCRPARLLKQARSAGRVPVKQAQKKLILFLRGNKISPFKKKKEKRERCKEKEGGLSLKIKVSNTQLAETLNVSRKTVSAIVNERASVTPDMALRLARAFGTSPELWLNLQKSYDLWQAARQSADWQKVLPVYAAKSRAAA